MAANTRPNKLGSLRLIIDRRLSAGALETVDFDAGAESARVRGEFVFMRLLAFDINRDSVSATHNI